MIECPAATTSEAGADGAGPGRAQPVLRFKTLRPGAKIPAYQSAGAAGLDLCACLPEQQPTLTIEPVHRGGKPVIVPIGLSMALPVGFEGQVRPRSGLAAKHGVTVANAPGTIDADYRGELMVALVNVGPEPFVIEHGMRIAQLVVAPVAQATIREVDELDTTARGSGGFGSTGLK